MNVRALSKAFAYTVSGLLSLLLLTQSVARETPLTSKSAASIRRIPQVEALYHPVPSRIRTLTRARAPRRILRNVTLTAAAIPTVTLPQLLAVADQPAFRPEHRILTDRVLRALPSGCRDNLKNFYILYDNAKQRGLGGKTTIIIDGNVPDTELAGLLGHECGHVIHANMQGTILSGDTVYKDGNDIFYKDSPIVSFFDISWMTSNVLHADARKADFVSGYAQSDAFEDFAETFAMYVFHRNALRTHAATNPAIAAKLAWMETHLPLPEDTLGTSQHQANKNIPWDITKLPLALKQ